MATRLSRYVPVAPATLAHRGRNRASVHVVRSATIDETPGEAALCDLSPYGCRLESPFATHAGERLWLRFADATPVAAEVMWSEAGTIACRFDAPLARTLTRSLTLAAA